MQPIETSSLITIPTKNRFDILQCQETDKSQPESVPTKDSATPSPTLELIRKRNEVLRDKEERYTSSRSENSMIKMERPIKIEAYSPPHQRNNKRHKRGTFKRTTLKGHSQRHRHRGYRHPAEEHADAPATAKGDSPPPPTNQHHSTVPKEHGNPRRKNLKY
jgi:hypothetical protein